MRLLLSLAAGSAFGMFMPGVPMPIERVIANTTAFLQKNPKSAEAHYLLGRLHSLAFATVPIVDVLKPKDESRLAQLSAMSPDRRPRETGSPLAKADIEHANAALAAYRKAVELAPANALYHFSLGWLARESSRFAPQLGGKPASAWLDEALREFRAAYQLALPDDLKALGYLTPLVSDQAGSALLEMLKTRTDAASRKEAAEVEKNVKTVRGKARAVTPVLFSRTGAPLENITSARTVAFDLDGTAQGRAWQWVRADACFLAWDPHRTGRIESGLQLFGTATWWMFWRNGYQALAALDDNHDGVLTGTELVGIAVWCDADSDGVSGAGEVTPAGAFGIVGIGVNVDGAAMYHPAGVRLAGGDVRPTIDWVSSGAPVR